MEEICECLFAFCVMAFEDQTKEKKNKKKMLKKSKMEIRNDETKSLIRSTYLSMGDDGDRKKCH